MQSRLRREAAALHPGHHALHIRRVQVGQAVPPDRGVDVVTDKLAVSGELTLSLAAITEMRRRAAIDGDD